MDSTTSFVCGFGAGFVVGFAVGWLFLSPARLLARRRCL